MVDLDAAEGLGTRAGREPSLVAVIIKHHSGSAGADNRLAAGREKRGRFHTPDLGRPERFKGTKEWEEE